MAETTEIEETPIHLLDECYVENEVPDKTMKKKKEIDWKLLSILILLLFLIVLVFYIARSKN